MRWVRAGRTADTARGDFCFGGAPTLVPNPGEVAEVFSVPLDFVLDPGNHREESFEHASGRRHYFSLQYGHHRIWGVTGNILRRFYEEVFR